MKNITAHVVYSQMVMTTPNMWVMIPADIYVYQEKYQSHSPMTGVGYRAYCVYDNGDVYNYNVDWDSCGY